MQIISILIYFTLLEYRILLTLNYSLMEEAYYLYLKFFFQKFFSFDCNYTRVTQQLLLYFQLFHNEEKDVLF